MQNPLRKVCFWLHSYLPYGDQLINTVFNCNLFRRRVCGGYVCMYVPFASIVSLLSFEACQYH